MDEARALISRLERIEALERDGAPADALLAELHVLLTEAEAWMYAERPGGHVEDALGRFRLALDAAPREAAMI